MIYRNSDCCFTPDEINNNDIALGNVSGCMNDECKKMAMDWNFKDGCRDKNNDCTQNNDGCSEDLKRRLSELQFAAIDLNLFLDTHPCDEEALKMFKKITKTIESVKYDYIKKYGPLMAGNSSDETPFQWASEEFKWPWEK